MGRAEWIIVAIVLGALALGIVGVLAFGMAAAPHVGDG